jgi:hypothetical protein
VYTEFWWKNLRERHTLRSLDLQEVGCVVMDWIDLAQDRGKCRALENAVTNLRVRSNAVNFLTS